MLNFNKLGSTILLNVFQNLISFVKETDAYLRVLSIDDILLPVEEPIGNFVLPRIGHNSDDFFDLKAFLICQHCWFAQM